jgi:hypothetical protein
MRKVSLGEMWRSEATGDVYVVTSFCREVLSCYAYLRSVERGKSESLKRVKLLKTDFGETLVGFTMAEIV